MVHVFGILSLPNDSRISNIESGTDKCFELKIQQLA